MGDFSGAFFDFSESLKNNPESYNSLDGRGDAKLELGDFPGAVSDFNESLKINPKSEHALFGRGEAKRVVGDFLGAISDFKRFNFSCAALFATRRCR